jgi:uncharacterized protein YecT (DUF1311 family)
VISVSRAFIVAALLTAPAPPVFAGATSARGYAPCHSVATADDRMACKTRQLTQQNQALGAIYSKYYAILSADQRKGLDAAERTWISFRDADCESARSQITMTAGAGLGIIIGAMDEEKTDCLLSDTHDRIIVLGQRYEEERAWQGRPIHHRQP